MKIVMLAAGAAGRYCGTCLHDNTLAAALIKAKQDVMLVPMYTPLRTDEASVSQSKIFFGGVNVYLQQKSSLFRHTPSFVDSLLDSPKLLSWLSKRSAGMEAAQLGELTVSTLKGEEGNQRKELEKLVQWLENDVRPTVVHLNNTLLVGAARELSRRLKVPIVCSLAGEDIFLDQLQEPHFSQSKELIRQGARHVQTFIALNHYFADYAADYFGLERSKIRVIPHGLNLEGHAAKPPSADNGQFTIGYFARIAPEKGLHQLVEAFALLAKEPGLPRLKLRAAGYKSSADETYFTDILARVRALGLEDRFEYVGEVDRAGKIAFLHSVDVISVPTIYHESKGISVIEALANAVPVVLPAHGTFPELVEDTGGGLVCEPGNPAALAAALKRLVQDRALTAELGRHAREAILTRYNAEEMARQTVELYREVAAAQSPRAAPVT